MNKPPLVAMWALLVLSFILACLSGSSGIVAFLGGIVSSVILYEELFINKKVDK